MSRLRIELKDLREFVKELKDLREFVKTERVLYASSKGRSLFVALRTGLNEGRYAVEIDGKRTRFTRPGDAVRLFNDG